MVVLKFRDAPEETLILNGSDIPFVGTKRSKAKTTNNFFSAGTIRIQGTSNREEADNGFDKIIIKAGRQLIKEITLDSFDQGFPVDVTFKFDINESKKRNFNRAKITFRVVNEKETRKSPSGFGVVIKVIGN